MTAEVETIGYGVRCGRAVIGGAAVLVRAVANAPAVSAVAAVALVVVLCATVLADHDLGHVTDTGLAALGKVRELDIGGVNRGRDGSDEGERVLHSACRG